MEWRTFARLYILLSLAGIASVTACLILIPGIPVGPCTALIFLFLFFFVLGLYEELRLYTEKKRQAASQIFGHEPVRPDYESQKKWDMLVLSFLGGGLIAVIFFYLIHKYAGLAALIFMVAGLLLISRRAAQRKIEAAERVETRFKLYGGTTPVEFVSYRFDNPSLSRVAEILSASRVSELPGGMPYYDKIDRLAKDGCCVIFARGSGTDRILAGVQAVMARRGFDSPVITKEAVMAADSEQIRNRRRDGEDTDDNDLNCIGRILEDAGFVLLDLLYHPYNGHVITVASNSEMGQIRELKFDDLKEMQSYR